MGRRPPAARSKQKAQTVEIVNPSIGGAGTPFEGTNPPLGQVELQPENTNQTLGGVEVQPKKQANSGNSSLKRKGRYSSDVAVRRSARLQDVVVPVHFQEIERLIEEVALSESEKEDDLPTNEETEINQSDSTMRDTNLGEKIDYLVRLLKEQRKTIETLELLATKRSMSGEIPCSSQTKYKNLYFKSQKKVEAITEENRQLAMKLEIAVAKLEGYEKGTRANSDMMEKLKDVILVSNLTQATQNAINTLQGKARVTSLKTRVTSPKTRKIREVQKK